MASLGAAETGEGDGVEEGVEDGTAADGDGVIDEEGVEGGEGAGAGAEEGKNVIADGGTDGVTAEGAGGDDGTAPGLKMLKRPARSNSNTNAVISEVQNGQPFSEELSLLDAAGKKITDSDC
ncbi:hypothetical protein AXG93_4472s1050 [Marchantia polymorpha subsp. ruderalis]|uniref:Uncharacterized protein n=1 Tax=Marchantia polymorpha subsp. ruderalis TaxID=1480154 RepID=A0A176VIN5_MARPO|nr:hypothetical protein AXG93_4472s1050 [Marchantia polymorpha subsp. ruderalis]